MKLLEIIDKLDSAFPVSDAADWDFVGWQVKGKNKNLDIANILIALDITESVISEAIHENIKLIIVHHPFIFSKSISTLTNSKWKKLLYQTLKKYNINVYVLHTNFDSSPKGMGYLIAQDLKLKNITHFDHEKLSVLGTFDNIPLKTVIKNIKSYFGFKKIKVVTNNLTTKINKVIVAPGAGGMIIELLNKSDSVANKKDISLIITGEMKWHQEIEARDKNINVLIVGHNMEEKFVDFISIFLHEKIFTKESVKIRKYFFQQAIYN